MLSFENWSVKRSESSRTKLTMKLWNNVSWVIAVKMTPNWLTIRPADFNSLFLPNNIILSSIQSANEATDPFGVISVNCFVTGTNYNCNSLTCSGCGSVGKAVASDTRGPRFESSHRQKFIYILNICLLSTAYWKDENKEKRGREWPIF